MYLSSSEALCNISEQWWFLQCEVVSLNPNPPSWRTTPGRLSTTAYSPNIARAIKSIRLRWAVHVAGIEEGRSAFKILIGKTTGKRPLGRPRRRWKDNAFLGSKRDENGE